MSILRKITSFLFQEAEDIEEEGELEEISLSNYKKEEKPKASRYEEAKQEYIRVEDATVKKPIVQDELPPQEQKHFTNIEIAKEEPQKTKEVQKRSKPTQVREKEVRKETGKQEYVFTPVISPIFGATDQDNKTLKKTSGTVKNSSTVTKASKKNPLATIISPMYGASELEEFEEKAKAEQKQEEQPKIDISSVNENMMKHAQSIKEEEDMVNVPLADLLAKEDVLNGSEDLLQFSLFGDDEVVRTDIEEDSYTIKE